MKKVQLLTTTMLALALAGNVRAQDHSSAAPSSKFYIKVTGGYFFSVFPGQYPNVGPFPPQDLHTELNPPRLDTISRKVLTGSYGEGARGGLAFGYNINKYMAVEASFNYYHSRKNLMTRNLTTLAGSGKQLVSVESYGHVNAVDFAPSLVLNPGFEKVNPYVRFGVVVPLWGRLYIDTDVDQLSSPAGIPAGTMVHTVIHRKEQVKPNITLGFQGALGVSFYVSPRIDIFVEAEYRNVPVRSKEKEITAYEQSTNIVNASTGAVVAPVPGQPTGLNDLSVAEKNTKYVTTLDKNSNTPINQQGSKVYYKNDNEPSNDLKSYINIGGLGANAGIKIKF
ncbi:outer membrane beta-barrel protein [Chitinophaga qingshengii]|uniref:Outer membrane beta-barrel protein n=1 Tax=Chitinophaga qingshengii TaxID=1569794 RepID=A0ABR7TSL3_9BACT|nr:outer membrane beta-barrel protein [Chitinophaga qingshengii]MBC9933470.1 outer membrane beta-barrel protein [Chitinophaga qingshengii]